MKTLLVWLTIASTALAEQATVNFGSPIRPLTHAGSGVLLSLDMTTPSDELLGAIKPSVFRGAPDSPSYHRAMDHDATFQMGLSESYVTLPGDNGNWTTWEERCRQLAQQSLGSDKIQLEIWNEPDQPYFWGRSRDQYFEAWKRAVNVIREVNPQAKIIGPSVSKFWWFGNTNVMDLLTYAKANNVLPDIISWHSWDRELGDEVDYIRNFGVENSIDTSHISINEYLWWFDQYRPGPIVYYLNTIEQKQLDNGIKSCWGSCFDNSLDGLLSSTGQPLSTYWIYERYGRMHGSSVVTVSGGDSTDKWQETLDVVASADTGVAYALVGRYKDSYLPYLLNRQTNNYPDVITPADLLIQHLDEVESLIQGDRVHVLAEFIKNSENNASLGPVTMIDADFPVLNGQLDLHLPNMGTFDAYFLTFTPPKSPLAGDYNSDGIVDAADYVLMRIIDDRPSSVDLWRTAFGKDMGLTSISVPEPSVMVLLLAGLCWVSLQRR